MKKTAAILLSLALIFSLCSCGQAEEPQAPAQPDTAQTAETPAAPAAPAETPAAPTQEEPAKTTEDAAENASALYKDFLCGKQTLKINSDYACFTAGETYLIDDFIDAFADYKSEDWVEAGTRKLYYSYLDCGLDGIPELALELEVSDDEYYDAFYQYFVINCPEDTPVLVDGFDYYYRNYSYLNEAGIVENGGSSGAASYSYDYTQITGEGEEVFLYDCSIEMANPKPAIPSWYLPKEIPDDYYDMWADGDNEEYFTVHAYNFKDFGDDWDSDDYDERYDVYCRDYFFTITNENGDDVAPAEEYASLYKENNINIVTQDEAGKMIADRMEELGVTEDIINAPYINYSVLDAEKINDDIIVNDDGSVTVGCAANLIDSIADGATIYLKPGVYNLSNWVDINAGEYGYNNYARCRCYPYAYDYNNHIFFAGSQVLISRINNLTIASLDPQNPAEIVTDDEFNMVLSFCECSDLTLRDLVAGHTKGNEGHCSADVFEFNACDRVELYDCDLYGCGCYGIMATDTAGLTVNGGRIHDCTSGMVELYQTSPAEFSSVVFENCHDDWGAMFVMYDSSADFYSCTFKNLGNMFQLDSSSAWVSACTMDEAAEKSIRENAKFDEGLYMWEN